MRTVLAFSILGFIALVLPTPSVAETEWTASLYAGIQTSGEDLSVRGAERELTLDIGEGSSFSLGLLARLTDRFGLAAEIGRSSLDLQLDIQFDSGSLSSASGDADLLTLKLMAPIVLFDSPSVQAYVSPMAVWNQIDDIALVLTPESDSTLAGANYDPENDAGLGLRLGIDYLPRESSWVFHAFAEYFEAAIESVERDNTDVSHLSAELNPMTVGVGIGWRF
ncbi:MAG: hypothetical protein K8J08_20610 [Thermoanaerobaculia bacterium]|nr:hypothetical protein [Thermoanaerobaculia bacterium]